MKHYGKFRDDDGGKVDVLRQLDSDIRRRVHSEQINQNIWPSVASEDSFKRPISFRTSQVDVLNGDHISVIQHHLQQMRMNRRLREEDEEDEWKKDAEEFYEAVYGDVYLELLWDLKLTCPDRCRGFCCLKEPPAERAFLIEEQEEDDDGGGGGDQVDFDYYGVKVKVQWGKLKAEEKK